MQGVGVTQKVFAIAWRMFEERDLDHFEHLTKFIFDLGRERYAWHAIQTIHDMSPVFIESILTKFFEDFPYFSIGDICHVGDALLSNF